MFRLTVMTCQEHQCCPIAKCPDLKWSLSLQAAEGVNHAEEYLCRLAMNSRILHGFYYSKNDMIYFQAFFGKAVSKM